MRSSSATLSIESSAATKPARTIVPPAAIATMRRRSCAERLVRNVNATSRAAVNAHWPQAAREKVNSTAVENSATSASARAAPTARSVKTRPRARSIGNTRKAPSTFGSLNVPRARS